MTHKEQFLKSLIVLDTETTSLDFREAEIIELGYILRNNEGGWETVNDLYKPSVLISPEVSEVTHIVDEDVADCKESYSGILEDFKPVVDAFRQVNGFYVAHNAFYDRSVFEHGYAGVFTFQDEWLCTMRMAKKLFANDPEVEKFRLFYLRYLFKLDVPRDLEPHRASSDAYVTAVLMEFMVNVMEERGIIDVNEPYGPQIFDWLNEPIIIDTMQFGKHKGKKLVDIPLSYWQWALSNMDSLNEEKPEYDKDFAASVVIAMESILDQ